MSELSNYYKILIQDLENNLESKKDFEYVKNSLEKIFNSIEQNIENRIEKIEEKQTYIEERIDRFDEKMDKFDEEFLFDEDMIDDDSFEIACPYCNYTFEADLSDSKTEINCPECDNVIELDWGIEETQGCASGGCSSCPGCGGFKNDDSEEDDDM